MMNISKEAHASGLVSIYFHLLMQAEAKKKKKTSWRIFVSTRASFTAPQPQGHEMKTNAHQVSVAH